MEIELKLILEADAIDALLKHPLIRQLAKLPPATLQLQAVYYDTPDNVLWDCQMGLRVRKEDEKWLQTLKSDRVAGALNQRYEWETPLVSPNLDLYALRNAIDRKGPWRELISEPSIASALKPIFNTDVKRTRWDLITPEGDEIELALDRGLINFGESSQVVREIELELKSGDPLKLINIALTLLNDIPMRLGYETKSERGYRMAADRNYSAVKANSLQLSPKLNIDQAFVEIFENCLSHIQANQSGVASSEDIDSLHQMRVGLRRLKSALKMFNTVIQLPDVLRADLDWLGDELGEARDWDVLASSTLPKIDGDDLAIEKIRAAAAEKSKVKHQAASAALNSTRYARFLLRMLQWIGTRAWRSSSSHKKDKNLNQGLKRFSTKLLGSDRRRLSKRGNALEDSDSQKRHQVRIAAKKVRYDTEFFQSLYPQKETKIYIKALSKVQDELGWLNDIAVGQGLLMELQSENKDLASAAGYVRGYLSARETEGRKEAKNLWKKFKAKHLTK
jgi:inorganic triphosphatase YgiF